MGDTINEFILFVTNNPLMLGLCIAIVVLFIVLIIVLFSGNKTTTTVVNEENNDAQANQEGVEPVLSSNEVVAPLENAFTKENIQNTFDDINKENGEEVQNALFTEEEAPINIDEALNLKDKAIENDLNDKKPIPVPVELKKPEGSVSLEVPVAPIEPVLQTGENISIGEDLNEEKNNEFNDLINEINLMRTSEINPQSLNQEPEQNNIFNNVIPPSDEKENKEEVNLNKLFEDDSFLNPNKEAPIKESSSSSPVFDPISYSFGGDTNIFDNSASDVSKPEPVAPIEEEEENLDDVELPKFKEETSDAFNNLKGESFNI